MKILTPILVVFVTSLIYSASYAQPDSAKISEKALFYADSLVKTDGYENWSVYADLAPLPVIKFYGGRDGYLDHVRTARMRTLSTTNEDLPQLKVLSLMTANDQWQCLVRVSRYFHKEEKKFHQVTYFLGQSKDEGETWKIFDLSFNKIANVIYLFPEVFGDMAIPEPSILSEQEEIAQQQAQEAAAASKKQAPKRK
ncbi:MAG TPA: hypothetical protein VL832_27875 [Puia sp.]|jgi:hypothetical protein|nr:hypothetical protein [Puia sp.]